MRNFLFLLLAILSPLSLLAQPTAAPVMTYIDADGFETEETEYDGSAPLTATFTAHISGADGYTALCEWRFVKAGESAPFLTRFDEDTQYTFTQSGSYTVQLLISFVQGADTIEYVQDDPFTVNIRESRLEFPNAFTPNGDGINDIFKAKDGWQSIVSFHAQVFNRSGRLLYEWRDPAGGWDGRSGGRTVPDGAYYLRVDARGADGHHYDIRKTINVLTGYREETR
ncbi:MAG: gliding motility-associated C-terminal domain-containing protein [Bacteroidaceae bacterium]|nr:gliding motility-associated C-terminal domain-containing protein [Bacteroidaceae bacterium]